MLYLLLSTAAPFADLMTTDWISFIWVPALVMTEVGLKVILSIWSPSTSPTTVYSCWLCSCPS